LIAKHFNSILAAAHICSVTVTVHVALGIVYDLTIHTKLIVAETRVAVLDSPNGPALLQTEGLTSYDGHGLDMLRVG
jgi:hypothetical protein